MFRSYRYELLFKHIKSALIVHRFFFQSCMNDYEIVIEAYTHSFCRSFDNNVFAIVHDNVRNIDARSLNLTSHHYLSHTMQLRVKGALVSKLL